MRFALIWVTFTLVATGTLQAATQVQPGVQPFLLVHSEILTSLGLPPGPDFLLEQGDIFVARNGLTNSVQVLLGGGRFKTVLARGNSAPQNLSALTTAFGVSRIGTLVDCQIVNGIPGGGSHTFNWYGRGERTNKFTIYVSRDALPGIPGCSDETVALLDELSQFTVTLLGRPDTSVIVSE